MSQSPNAKSSQPRRRFNCLKVGRAVLSAPRLFEGFRIWRALSTLRGALGTARPTWGRRRVLGPSAGSFAFLFLFASLVLAQFSGEITDFRYIPAYHAPPHEKQMQALLEGARAQPLPGRQARIIEGKLHSFLPTGEPELNVTAPEAIYHQDTRNITSSGHLRVETADGRFSIEGDGFQWQTNRVLFISNRVHTVVLPDLLNAKSARPHAATPMPNLDVVSERFCFTGDSGLAVYDGGVRVAGTNLWLTSGSLTLKVPQSGRRQEPHPKAEGRLETIRAEQNVVLNYTNADHEHIHATGGQALYAVAADQLRVTDHPAWQTALRQGSGDEVFIDATNKIFRTTGQAWLKLASPGKGSGGLLPQIDLLATSAPPTNQVVEIRSDAYEFRTNFAVFNRHVHLTQHVGNQSKGQLDCGVLTVWFAGTNQLQRMVAEQDVVLQQEDKAFTGGKAVYTPTNALLELTEHPAWRAGLRQGKGDRLLINVTNAELLVRGNASMRVPGGEVTPPMLGRSPLTNANSKTPTASLQPATLEPHTAAFADIFADEYTMRRDRDRLVSHFRGGVSITHPQMNLVCSTMTVTAPLEANRGETILVADQEVQFDLMDTQGQRHHGKGDKAVYTHSVKNGVTNDVVVLTGNPALLQTTLQATNSAVAQNNAFTLDLGRGTISGAGQYVFTGTAPAFDTNKLKMPNMRPKR